MTKPKSVQKRDTQFSEFNIEKISKAINAAFINNKNYLSIEDRDRVDEIVITITENVEKRLAELDTEYVHIEVIQDYVIEEINNSGYLIIGELYEKYRKERAYSRSSFVERSIKEIDSYINKANWNVKENSNMRYSLQGLNVSLFTDSSKEYWLNKVYSKEIANAHYDKDMHIHDLYLLSAYCVGWDLKDILQVGFTGVPGKITSKPAKHFTIALNHIFNFIFTLQGEAAGAEALSNFDTLLAPFIYYDGLNEQDVKRALESFLFNMNVPTRVGFQCPFSNITMDLVCPKHMQNELVIVGGEYKSKTYGEFQKEMDMLNIAFAEVMTKGDGAGQLFSFPIPTYCIDDSFDWDNPNYQPIWEMTAKYGIPYFANYVNSDLSKEDSRSMCCRLKLDLTQLHKRGGGLFGANALTGSMGVVTINLPRIGHSAISKEDYFDKLNKVVDIAKDSLLTKMDFIEDLTEKGLYPYTSFYLRSVKERTKKYWTNHFLTIGIIGAHESCLNFLGKGIDTEEGHAFAIEIMDFLNAKVIQYQKDYDKLFNLEATPAEGLSYSFYRADKAKYPDMKCFSLEDKLFYTNSTALPVDTKLDLFSALAHQDTLQPKYTGGTVYHIFLGERVNDTESVKKLIKKILHSYKIQYISVTPSFSICRDHGYLVGEQDTCPICGGKTLIYSRAVGYIRSVSDWHEGKQDEFGRRTNYDNDIK